MKDPRWEVIKVDGWTVIVTAHLFTVNEQILFFEIDAFLPNSDLRFWHLVVTDGQVFDGEQGHRVRSSTKEKWVSQGAVFPLSLFPEVRDIVDDLKTKLGPEAAEEELSNMSFEDKLGIKKWEIETTAGEEWAPVTLGRPPSFFPQPYWVRAQNMRELFSPENTQKEFQISEKLDGISMTVYGIRAGSAWYHGLPPLPAGCTSAMETSQGRVGVCSRTRDFMDTKESLHWQVAKAVDLPSDIWRLGRNIAIQGELCGSMIQGNSMGYAEGEHEFFVFAMFDIDDQKYLPGDVVEQLCRELKTPHTPVIGYKKLGEFADNLEDLLKKADGTGMKGQIREGLVFKSMDGMQIFKVVSNTWLMDTGK
jgi:RNA ligase (TIGR02306 family)